MKVRNISETKLKSTTKSFHESYNLLPNQDKIRIKTLNNFVAKAMGYKGAYANLVAACRANAFIFDPLKIDFSEIARQLTLMKISPVCWINQRNLFNKFIDDDTEVEWAVMMVLIHSAISQIYDLVRSDQELQYYILYHLKNNIFPAKGEEFVFSYSSEYSYSYSIPKAVINSLAIAELMDWRGIGLESVADTLIEYKDVNEDTPNEYFAEQGKLTQKAFSQIPVSVIRERGINTFINEIKHELDANNFFDVINVGGHIAYWDEEQTLYQDDPEYFQQSIDPEEGKLLPLPFEVDYENQTFKLLKKGIVASEGNQNFHFVPLPQASIDEMYALGRLKESSEGTFFGLMCQSYWSKGKEAAWKDLKDKWLRVLQGCRFQ